MTDVCLWPSWKSSSMKICKLSTIDWLLDLQYFEYCIRYENEIERLRARTADLEAWLDLVDHERDDLCQRLTAADAQTAPFVQRPCSIEWEDFGAGDMIRNCPSILFQHTRKAPIGEHQMRGSRCFEYDSKSSSNIEYEKLFSFLEKVFFLSSMSFRDSSKESMI